MGEGLGDRQLVPRTEDRLPPAHPTPNTLAEVSRPPSTPPLHDQLPTLVCLHIILKLSRSSGWTIVTTHHGE
jgi:hypothetical protein